MRKSRALDALWNELVCQCVSSREEMREYARARREEARKATRQEARAKREEAKKAALLQDNGTAPPSNETPPRVSERSRGSFANSSSLG